MKNEDHLSDEQSQTLLKSEKKPIKPFTRLLIIILVVFLVGALIGFFIFWQSPLADVLDLSAIPIRQVPEIPGLPFSPPISKPSTGDIDPDQIASPTPIQSDGIVETPISPQKKPLCGQTTDMIILLVGLDYDKPDPGYLYGLADVIRLIHVDFSGPKVNIVSLPRALLVDIIPEHYTVSGPILINQSYLFGARGMGFYLGDGFGAGSLGETIKYNFGITVDHYLVVNFTSFVRFIDAIGGIDIDLPTFIDDRPDGFFPAGKQHLDGERTLYLARIRKKYSDLVRINDQSLIIAAIFQRLKDPAIISRLPAIYESFKDSVITDASPSLIEDALCLFNKTSGSDLHFYDPYFNVMTYSSEFIPTVNRYMDVFFWDQHFLDWLYYSLWNTGND